MSYLKPQVTIPVSPKNSLYFPDGYGRDSYIFNDNGGLCKSGQRIVSSNKFPLSMNSIKSTPSK